MRDLFALFKPGSDGASLLNSLYRGLGVLAVASASNVNTAVHAAAASEVAALREQNASLLLENAALRTSTSWRLTAPLRLVSSALRRR